MPVINIGGATCFSTPFFSIGVVSPGVRANGLKIHTVKFLNTSLTMHPLSAIAAAPPPLH